MIIKIIDYLRIILLLFLICLIGYKIGMSTENIMSIIGPVIGVIGAYSIARYQLYEDKKEKNVLRKPILYLQDYETPDLAFDIHSDQSEIYDAMLENVLYRDEIYNSDLNDNLRTISVKLINASSMPMYEFNFDWELSIDGLKRKNFTNRLIISSLGDDRYKFFKKNMNFPGKNDPNKFFYYKYKSEEHGMSGNGTIEISGTNNKLQNYVESYDTLKIPFPISFLRLIENKIIESDKLLTPEDFIMPDLILKINFLNYEMKEYTVHFKIVLKNYHSTKRKYNSNKVVTTYKLKFKGYKIKEEQLKVIQ